MNTFLFESGDGNVYDNQGRETHVYELEVDMEQYPLEQLINYDTYMYQKPPENWER